MSGRCGTCGVEERWWRNVWAKRPPGRLGHRWDDNIKMDLQ